MATKRRRHSPDNSTGPSLNEFVIAASAATLQQDEAPDSVLCTRPVAFGLLVREAVSAEGRELLAA